MLKSLVCFTQCDKFNLAKLIFDEQYNGKNGAIRFTALSEDKYLSLKTHVLSSAKTNHLVYGELEFITNIFLALNSGAGRGRDRVSGESDLAHQFRAYGNDQNLYNLNKTCKTELCLF